MLGPAEALPSVSQWHDAARGCAGLHGPLLARHHVPHVHWGIPGNLQEPAAVSAPEVSGVGESWGPECSEAGGNNCPI